MKIDAAFIRENFGTCENCRYWTSMINQPEPTGWCSKMVEHHWNEREADYSEEPRKTYGSFFCAYYKEK